MSSSSSCTVFDAAVRRRGGDDPPPPGLVGWGRGERWEEGEKEVLILVSVCPMSVRPSVRRRLLFVFPQYIGIYPPSVVRSLLLLFSFGCRDGGAGDIAFLRPTSLVRKFFLLVPRGGHPWRGRGPLQLPGARLPWHCGRKGQWRGLIDRDLLLLRPSWLGDMYMSTRVGPMPKNVLVSQRHGQKNGWGVGVVTCGHG